MIDSPFDVRGVLEAFYGTFYTFPQRNSLIRFLGENNFNFYIYGPKDDRHHRRDWRKPYPTNHMKKFAQTVAIARESGVTFVYALSPGATIRYNSQDDFAALTDKLRSFYDMGVRDFSLFLDDIVPKFNDGEDGRYFRSYAAAQADLCNRTYTWLQELDDRCTLSMCPTDYYGSPPFSPYLHELGQDLHEAIDIFYTGPQVCSKAISTEDAAAFAEAARRPPIIWDNYPVNDLRMELEMHIGPIRNRDETLHEVVRGFAVNLMLESEASKIPLLTFGSYFLQPEQYDPEQAWLMALACIGGEESLEALQVVAENYLRSCLGRPDVPKIERLTKTALRALEQGASPTHGTPLIALEKYLNRLSNATYHLSYYMENLALRHELRPWLEALNVWRRMGQYALRLLRALEHDQPYDYPLRRVKELLVEVEHRPKRMAATALQLLAQFALAQVEGAPVAAVQA